MTDLKFKISSFQSLGTVDGPGVRAVVFMQGCPLRCHCCHNPETWDIGGGKDISQEELFHKILRCKAYFGTKGGVTFSGGEPLLQAEALLSFIPRLREENIHIALDTSGCILNTKVKKLIDMCDLVLLDYKYTNDADYLKYTGMQKSGADEFLDYLNKTDKPTWIRQVIIPDVNDTQDSVNNLYELKKKCNCIEKIELLPFRKLCIEKYNELGINFPFESYREATKEDIEKLKSVVN
ncbi:MAG: pyruvate formate-lyase-activating protein [Acutalibacteraceae bacterium]|nr:pyruvate formate-lyase-activating protein [Acutalibacteraceae bacterium]